MRDGIQTLSEREKETLRLLLSGHDAKSIARTLGLSVHTINERLRDARRKTGVSSSREAARQLAAFEADTSYFHVHKALGGARSIVRPTISGQPDRSERPPRPVAWAIGGMLAMLLIIVAAAALWSAGPETGVTPPAPATAMPRLPAVGEKAARDWLALVDTGRWNESWNAAGRLIRSSVPQTSWAGIVQPVRQPLGAVASRTLLAATWASVLPGAPPGDYWVMRFRTRFAQKADAIETITVAREGSAWKVSGYYIR